MKTKKFADSPTLIYAILPKTSTARVRRGTYEKIIKKFLDSECEVSQIVYNADETPIFPLFCGFRNVIRRRELTDIVRMSIRGNEIYIIKKGVQS